MLMRTLGLAAIILLLAAPGYATTFYVAGNGTGGTCTSSTPCNNISTALDLAAAGDVILCVSSPAPAAVIIVKSITIDCSSARAPVRDSIVVSGGLHIAILINVAVNPADPFRTVRLRGLDIDGLTSGTDRTYDRGIDIRSATAVHIEDCFIANASQQGIFDHRTGGQTKLFIKDTIVSGNAGAGIVAVSAAVGITTLDNVTSQNNAYGIAVGNGNNVEIRNSVFSGNSTAGIEGDAGSHVVVSGSAISHNNIGVQSSMSVRIKNNEISFNNTAFSGLAATLGLNSYNSNVSPGTIPSPVPGAPSDIGP